MKNLKLLATLCFAIILTSCDRGWKPNVDAMWLMASSINEQYADFNENDADISAICNKYAAAMADAKSLTEALPIYEKIISEFGEKNMYLSYIPEGSPYINREYIGKPKPKFDWGYMEGTSYYFMQEKSVMHGGTVGDMYESDGCIVDVSHHYTYIDHWCCSDEMLTSIAEKQGNNPMGVIVDLRMFWDDESIDEILAFTSLFHKGNYPSLQYAERVSTKDKYTLTPKETVACEGKGVIPESLPVVLIVGDETSVSNHLIASILRELPNVTVIGKTATVGGGSLITEVPIGENTSIHFPAGKKFYVKGISCENPLTPDVIVSSEPLVDFRGTVDRCLVEAIRLINSQTQD